jgi:hypothetical protein
MRSVREQSRRRVTLHGIQGRAELHEAIGTRGRDIGQREQVEIRAPQIGQPVFGDDIRARPLQGRFGIARITVMEIAVMGDEDRPALPELDAFQPDQPLGAAGIGQHRARQHGFLHRIDGHHEGLCAIRAA